VSHSFFALSFNRKENLSKKLLLHHVVKYWNDAVNSNVLEGKTQNTINCFRYNPLTQRRKVSTGVIEVITSLIGNRRIKESEMERDETHLETLRRTQQDSKPRQRFGS